MAEKNAENVLADDQIEIKLNFRIPSRMPSVFAHHLFVQKVGTEVTLSFFEVISPIVPADQQDELMETLKVVGLNAECVARIKVSKDNLPAFAKVMNTIAQEILNESGEVKQDADDQQNNSKD